MKEYCNLHGIIIYNEEEKVDSDDVIKGVKQRGSKNLSEEEKIRLNKVKIITKHIMCLASVKARKIVQGRGWLCGTYTSNVRKTIERHVMRKFDELEMNYIIEHLPVENDEDTCFMMKDADDPQRIIHYNDELNRMIARLYINRFYKD